MTVPLALRHGETAAYFGPYVCDGDNATGFASVPEAEWSGWLAKGGADNGHGEFSCSTAAVSDVLLRADRCIIHAVSFRFGDAAWLISGPSGVGKSTQVRNLQAIRPDEFAVICGDRTALELREDGRVFAHPTPWNGKENWKGAGGAPLAGLIQLERGEENAFTEISPENAVLPLVSALISTGESEEIVLSLARFADSFLRRVPIYRLTSHEVPESTGLLYDALFS